MWVYPGPCCPKCTSSEELSLAEVDAQIHKVLVLEVKRNLDLAYPLCKEGWPTPGLVRWALFQRLL
jgi:hypothetical protein